MRWLSLLLVAVGCTQSPQDRADVVCTTFCDCAAGTNLPALVQECIDTDCLPTLPTVSDACLACVYAQESTCTNLVELCTNDCLKPAPGGP